MIGYHDQIRRGGRFARPFDDGVCRASPFPSRASSSVREFALRISTQEQTGNFSSAPEHGYGIGFTPSAEKQSNEQVEPLCSSLMIGLIG